MALQTLGGAVLQVSTVTITVKSRSVQSRYSAADCCLPVTHTCTVELACSMRLLSQACRCFTCTGSPASHCSDACQSFACQSLQGCMPSASYDAQLFGNKNRLCWVRWCSAALNLQTVWYRKWLSSQCPHSSLPKNSVAMSIHTSHCIIAPAKCCGLQVLLIHHCCSPKHKASAPRLLQHKAVAVLFAAADRQDFSKPASRQFHHSAAECTGHKWRAAPH